MADPFKPARTKSTSEWTSNEPGAVWTDTITDRELRTLQQQEEKITLERQIIEEEVKIKKAKEEFNKVGLDGK
jgi:hypothetical protein